MEFTGLPPGAVGRAEGVPVVLRGSVGRTGGRERPSRTSLDSVLSVSTDWSSLARSSASWTTTATGWVIGATAAGSGYLSTRVSASDPFGWLASWGGHPAALVVLAGAAVAVLLVTAAFTRGLRLFTHGWLRAFQTGCVMGIAASAGMIAAGSLAVVFAAAALAMVIACLWMGMWAAES